MYERKNLIQQRIKELDLVNIVSNNENSQQKEKIIPKGLLIPIGGLEDRINDRLILSTIVSLIKKKTKIIEVITTATEYPKEVAKCYFKAFKNENNTVKSMHITSLEEANDDKYVKRITEADIVFLTGGSQLRIASILGGSSIEKEIIRKYQEENFIIAGTSAGASVMSETMIYRGKSEEALNRDTINMSPGMGLIDNVIFDTHVVERGRFTRLMQMVIMNTKNKGIGLGEDAALVIKDGNILQAIGNGITVIMDGQHLKHTNVAIIASKEALAIENLVVHTIVHGYGYDLSESKYLKPEDLKKFNILDVEASTNENN